MYKKDAVNESECCTLFCTVKHHGETVVACQYIRNRRVKAENTMLLYMDVG